MDKAQASIDFSSIQITSDGTAAGTKILLNGKEIKDLTVLNFTFYNDAYGSPVSMEFSTRDPEYKAGTLAEFKRFSLIPPAEQAKASLTSGPTVPTNLLPREDRLSRWVQL